MPVFGMKAPESVAERAAAADFCRRNGLLFMETEESGAGPEQIDGIRLIPRGRAVYLAEAEGAQMEKRLQALDRGQPVVLLPERPESLGAFALWANCWLNRQSGGQELWDVYDGGRRLTGRLHPRGLELGPGDFHLVVHVWMKNSRGEYLLTKRSPGKGYGGMWESPGGAAQAGDDSLSACLREIREETGLELIPGKGRIVKSYMEDHFFCDVWLFHQDFKLEDVVLQEGETCDCMYAGAEQIIKMHDEGRFVPFQYIQEILEAD